MSRKNRNRNGSENKKRNGNSAPPSELTKAESAVGLYFLHALTPLHFGVGEGLDDINLPTARDVVTRHPLAPGSSVKGVLREAATSSWDKHIVYRLFGPPKDASTTSRGGIGIGDAKIVALPLRSLAGTFAWTTSPGVLRRFLRDARLIGDDRTKSLEVIVDPDDDRGLVTKNSRLRIQTSSDKNASSKIALEEHLLAAETDDEKTKTWAETIASWAWPGDEEARDFFVDRFLVVSDDVFNLYCDVGLEVRTRVAIDSETGTAESSGPWTEEHIPAESLLAGVIQGRDTAIVRESSDKSDDDVDSNSDAKSDSVRRERAFADLQGMFSGTDGVLRFGGNATVGLGQAKFSIVGEKR